MNKTSRAALVGAIAAVLFALAASAGLADTPGQTVKIKSTITIGASGYQGKVKAANANCVEERTVVLKQKGNGVLSRVETKPNGNWKADLEALNENIKIPAKVFAEVKPVTQGTAGTIYKCLGAVSKTVEIAGG
ncbi:MAG TPA: hypothetical protein VFP17_07755 [Solirubrobacterales bacterium]|nr:hypothetical protein [Solirubrobacterales bacterium]